MNSESKKKLDNLEAKRILLKEIKEVKMFPKFYLCCAEAFNSSNFSHTTLNAYLENTIGYYLKQDILDNMIREIPKWRNPEKKINLI